MDVVRGFQLPSGRGWAIFMGCRPVAGPCPGYIPVGRRAGLDRRHQPSSSASSRSWPRSGAQPGSRSRLTAGAEARPPDQTAPSRHQSDWIDRGDALRPFDGADCSGAPTAGRRGRARKPDRGTQLPAVASHRQGQRRPPCTTKPGRLQAFWARLARERIDWLTPFATTLDWQLPFARWFEGGELNISHECLDRNVARGLGDKVAYHFIGEPGDTRTLTYADLLAEVQKAANALKELGVGRATGSPSTCP